MPRRIPILGVGLLVVVACTGQTTSTSLAPPTPTTTSPVIEVADLPGRLVTIDAGGNIVVIDPDGANPSAVTADAGPTARYSQPHWSPQSDRLAWSEFTSTGLGVGISAVDGSDRVRVSMDSPPFYMYWSPDGEAMGVLHNGPRTIQFEIVDTAAATAEVVAEGSPFYFSWSPDSARVVVHVQGEVFATIDREGQPEDLGATGADYQSPHWTEPGIFSLGVNGLELRAPGGGSRVLATTGGPVALVANPQGTRLAVQSFVGDDVGGINAAVSETPALPTNRVVVIDVESGEIDSVSETASVGFFWSPDGESLLVLEPRDEPLLADVLVWRDGRSQVLMVLSPHPDFVTNVLQFFDQYSQSLRLWSPDSSAVVLAGAVDEDEGIWVQSAAGGEAVKVAEGSWAVWSGS
jgi:TolB protein